MLYPYIYTNSHKICQYYSKYFPKYCICVIMHIKLICNIFRQQVTKSYGIKDLIKGKAYDIFGVVKTLASRRRQKSKWGSLTFLIDLHGPQFERLRCIKYACTMGDWLFASAGEQSLPSLECAVVYFSFVFLRLLKGITHNISMVVQLDSKKYDVF